MLQKEELDKFKDPCYIPVKGDIPVKKQRECIIDCDPGADDLHGIILGCYLNYKQKEEEKIKILGITTVNGNSNVKNGSINAALGLELLSQQGLLDREGEQIQVYQGCEKNLMMNSTSDDFYGQDGMSGYQDMYKQLLPNYYQRINQTLHGVDFLIQQLRKCGDQLDIIALGPLTNLGLALLKAPDTKYKIGTIYLMGGTYLAQGNSNNCVSEFNFSMDPQAAYIVFTLFNNIIQLPLETIWKHQQPSLQQQMFSGNTPLGVFIQRIYSASIGNIPYIILCDPILVALAFTSQSLVLSYYYKNVQVLHDVFTSQGMTVVDWRNQTQAPHNTYIIKNIQIQVIQSYLQNICSQSIS